MARCRSVIPKSAIAAAAIATVAASTEEGAKMERPSEVAELDHVRALLTASTQDNARLRAIALSAASTLEAAAQWGSGAPAIPPDELRAWASRQAELIRAAVL